MDQQLYRLMCSYGGRIIPRKHDNSLCYDGGDTRIIAISRTTNLQELLTRLSKTMLNDSKSFTLKYQLPNEELDSLITVSSGEDLVNLMDECDSNKNGRIRLFLIPGKTEGVGPTVDVSEEWFVNALNGGSDPNSGNCVIVNHVNESKVDENTTSSFGSASSSLMNLPPIRVHVGGGVEEEFAQMSVGVGEFQVEKRADEEFIVASQQTQDKEKEREQLGAEFPSPKSVSSDSSLSNAIARQNQVMYQDRSGQFSSESNRLTPGIPMQQATESGYAIHSQYEQYQQQLLLQQQNLPVQTQNQQAQAQAQPQTQQQYIPAGAHFVHHPPPRAIPMPAYYPIYPPQQPPYHPNQYPVYYVPAGQPQGYPLPGQHPPHMIEAPTPIPSTHTQTQTQAQAQAQAQTPPNPTTIIPTSPAYNPIRNMNTNMNMNMAELAPPNSEMGPNHGVYRTTTQMVQVPSNRSQPTSQSQPQPQQQQQQQQFVGYSQIHNPSQSFTPTSASYAHEFNDPAHSQIYYTEPARPGLGTHFQGVTSGSAMRMPDDSSLLFNDNIKQQIRSSQPL